MSFDFAQCEEPLSNIGFIQDFGALAWISREDKKIHFMSENFPNFVGIPKNTIKNETVLRLLNVETPALRMNINESIVEYYKDKRIIIRCHSDGWMTEWEQEHRELGDQSVSIPKLNSNLSEKEGLRLILQYIRNFSGFEQVLLYRFLPDGSGEVIEEINDGDRENYLGLRYPPTDIPQVARALYTKNDYRYIYDVNSVGHRILCLRDGPSPSLALTFSYLRGVSKFHIEYLKNMGISSAFSLSIAEDEELTELISLHHHSPKMLSHFKRESLAKAVKELVLFRRNKRLELRMKLLDRSKPLISKFLAILSGKEKAVDPILNELLQMTDADSLAYKNRNGWSVHGNTPSKEVLDLLAEYFLRKESSGLFQTDSLSSILAQDKQVKKLAAGLLAIWFGGQMNEREILFCFLFKREVIQEVIWGSKVKVEPALPHPINSFGRWKEKMEDHSKPWSLTSIIAAKTILAQMGFQND